MGTKLVYFLNFSHEDRTMSQTNHAVDELVLSTQPDEAFCSVVLKKTNYSTCKTLLILQPVLAHLRNSTARDHMEPMSSTHTMGMKLCARKRAVFHEPATHRL